MPRNNTKLQLLKKIYILHISTKGKKITNTGWNQQKPHDMVFRGCYSHFGLQFQTQNICALSEVMENLHR